MLHIELKVKSSQYQLFSLKYSFTILFKPILQNNSIHVNMYDDSYSYRLLENDTILRHQPTLKQKTSFGDYLSKPTNAIDSSIISTNV